MSFKFVSLYGVVVLLTSLFFQFVPLPDMLSWEEMLLSKLLNQAPILLCMGYLWFQKQRIKRADIFYLLMVFLFFNIFSEIYFYFVSDEYLLTFSIFNNILVYTTLLVLFIRQRIQLKEEIFKRQNIIYALLAGICFVTGFGISLVKVYEKHFFANKLFFFFVVTAMLMTSATVCLSFFVDKPFSRNWYKIVVGTVAMAVLDIYVYLSLFVFIAYTGFIYTIGKIIFSIGFLLIVDRTMRKCLNKVPRIITYRKTSEIA
jgi:hypothetical protein